MKNKDKYDNLKDAAIMFLKTKAGPMPNPFRSSLMDWDFDLWNDFALWMFKDEKQTYKVKYHVNGNSHVQTYIVDAESREAACKAFLRETGVGGNISVSVTEIEEA